MFKWPVLSLLVIVIDQLSKWIALVTLDLHSAYPVMPMFNFTLAYNYGAAFSFLSNAGGWQRWFFIILTFSVCVYIIWQLIVLSKKDVLLRIGFSLILGGAIGNLIDRVRLGYVIDFIDVYYGNAHFPTFNIADSAITIGAGLILLELLRQPAKTKTNRSTDKPNGR